MTRRGRRNEGEPGATVLRPEDLEVLPGGHLAVRHSRCIDCGHFRPVVEFGYRKGSKGTLRRRRCRECFDGLHSYAA